jgi:uncharacterized protein (TIGR02145 family)
MRTKQFYLFFFTLLLFVLSCNKPEKVYQPPKVYTNRPLEITTSKAVYNATFTKGSNKIIVYGFEWRKTTDSFCQKVTVQANNKNFTFSFTASNLEKDTEYIVKSFISDDSDTVRYGKEINFFTKGTVTDIDGNTYLTMRYNDKVWMTENLRVTRFADGTPIEARSGGKNNDSDGPVYYYDKNHTPQLSNPSFGLLYNWAAAAKADDCETTLELNPLIYIFPIYQQGICPDGWHLPSFEWNVLINSYGGNEFAANKMKTTNWPDPPYATDNFSYFSIEPAGFYHRDNKGGDFNGLYESAFFWTLTQNSLSGGTHSLGFQMVYGLPQIAPIAMPKRAGFSVRCVKD